MTLPPDAPAPDAAPVIAPGAQVSDQAVLGPGVRIGPFCMVGPGVVLEAGVHLHSHVVIEGPTRIGARTEIWPFSVVGGAPQHIRYKGEPTTLDVGPDCIIREQVSIHRGTVGGGGRTVLGKGVFVMAQVHVGHDCQVGDGVILAGGSALGGHVTVQDRAIIGGQAGVHQFCRIGEGAMIGGCAAVTMDVIPFGSAMGNHARLAGLNLVGLKRAGLSREAIATLRAAVQELFGPGPVPFRERLPQVAARHGASPEVARILAFIEAEHDRPILPFARH